ncbi:hypothetical protein IV102_28445 [bacterium]|nr:hypothetical protein [bacterium]
MSYQVLNYHRFLFQWHCRNFFRFRRYLSGAEKDYLETCFALAQGFEEVSESGYSHFSYYSYSHRVDGELVNSSRLAYGSVCHPGPAWQAARPVLAERSLTLPDFFVNNPVSNFYGLGWDLLERQFKVYFRVTQLTQLPAEVATLIGPRRLEDHREEGLVSYTYVDNQLSETKVYLYPRLSVELPEGVRGEAYMMTDRRGTVPQYDVASSASWIDKINPAGQGIVRLYQELDETLDTIAYTDPDHYTLYFP